MPSRGAFAPEANVNCRAAHTKVPNSYVRQPVRKRGIDI
jgi:hypothetical protein